MHDHVGPVAINLLVLYTGLALDDGGADDDVTEQIHLREIRYPVGKGQDIGWPLPSSISSVQMDDFFFVHNPHRQFDIRIPAVRTRMGARFAGWDSGALPVQYIEGGIDPGVDIFIGGQTGFGAGVLEIDGNLAIIMKTGCKTVLGNVRSTPRIFVPEKHEKTQKDEEIFFNHREPSAAWPQRVSWSSRYRYRYRDSLSLSKKAEAGLKIDSEYR